MGHRARQPRIALAIYRRLVALYPRSLRRELGTEMEGLFLDLHAEARAIGWARAAWFVLRAWAEVIPRAFQAHGDPDSPTGAYLVRSFFSDLKFAWQIATRQRRHTAVVVITMAIGIGATTAVFSITDAAILRPLPFPEPHRLVELAQVHPAGWAIFGQEPETFNAWSEQTDLFDRYGAYDTTSVVSEIAGEPREVQAVKITPGLLPVLGAQPIVGRLLLPEDAAEGAAPTVLISERVWQREFAGAADAPGGWLELGGVEHEVVGVLPQRFAFPTRNTDLWLPLDAARGEDYVNAMGRIAPGLSVEAAQERADVIAEGMAEANPREQGWKLQLAALEANRTSARTRTALLVALAAAGLLLIVAVVNVAQVALARSIQRESELTVRSALGAGRGRIIRQVMFESLLLSLFGGLLGVLLANGLVSMIAAAAPERLVNIAAVRMEVDWRSFAVALTLSVIAGAGAGLLPAWTASRPGISAALQTSPRGASVARHRRRLQSSLIVAEAALCLVLLAGAGLLMSSFGHLINIDPGFDADSTLSVLLRPDEGRYPTPETRLEMLQELERRFARLPGVESVAVAGGALPIPGGVRLVDSIEVEGGEGIDESTVLPYGRVGADFFRTAGVPILEGRALTAEDHDTPNAVIAEPLARRLFGEASPIGRRFRTEGSDWNTVVGMAAPIASFSLTSSDDDYQMYVSVKDERSPRAYAGIIVRATDDPEALAPALQRAVWDFDPEQAISRIEPGSDKIAGWVMEPRFNLMIFGTFAGVALLLVLVGIAGVVGHVVASRTREIGIRVALGAEPRSILAMATLGGLRPVLLGLALGGVAVWQTTHFLSSLLYGIEPNDLPTLLAVGGLFILATLVASYVPARRALRVDPVRALRAE